MSNFIREHDPYGIFQFCFGDKELEKAEEWIEATGDYSKKRYKAFFNQLNNEILFDPERITWIRLSEVDGYSIKMNISSLFLRKLSILQCIGVSDPGVCLLVSDYLLLCPYEVIEKYVHKNGEKVVADVLNCMIKHHDSALIEFLDKILGDNEYDSAYDAVCIITGTAYCFD